jgi:hypothetical protein
MTKDMKNDITYFDKSFRAEVINGIILENNKDSNFDSSLISDGYHTFKELYEFRKLYNAMIFNEWGNTFNNMFDPMYNVHKSRRHHDGEYPFGNDNWFIVCAELPTGQISNHYTMDDWDLFNIPEYEKALFPYDGHTAQDVITRITKLLEKKYE